MASPYLTKERAPSSIARCSISVATKVNLRLAFSPWDASFSNSFLAI